MGHGAWGIGHGEEAGEQGSRGQGREYKITSFSSAPFPLPLCLSLIPRLVSEVEPHPPHLPHPLARSIVNLTDLRGHSPH